jgi:hypothetical protein
MQKKSLANINVYSDVVHQIFVTDRRELEVHWNNTRATCMPQEILRFS